MSHCTEIYDSCPYNKSHIILRYRMQTHLHRCRQNFPLGEKVVCQFDSSHHVHSAELEIHLKTCTGRLNWEKSMCQFNADTDKPIVPQYEIKLPEPQEDWDDGAVGGYDPKAAAEKKNLIRGIHGAPPSERKNFKMQHRRHLQDLEAEAAEKGPIQSSDLPARLSQLSVDVPLRRPREPPQALLRLGQNAAIRPDSAASSAGSQQSVGQREPPATNASENTSVWVGTGRGKYMGNQVASPTIEPSRPINPWGRGRQL